MKAITNITKSIARKLLGAYIYGLIAGIIDYIINKKNPIVQILYLILAVGGFIVYVMVGF
jgi:hypothetical protein